MRAAILLASALLIAGTPAVAKDKAYPKGEAKLAKTLEGRTAGKPVSCINLRDIQSSTIIDRTAIVYDVGNKLYVNRPSIGATSLDSDDILLTKTHSSQLCRIDTVQLIDRTSQFNRGFVGLGDFVPYTKPKRART